jgi:hypothetical protein
MSAYLHGKLHDLRAVHLVARKGHDLVDDVARHLARRVIVALVEEVEQPAKALLLHALAGVVEAHGVKHGAHAPILWRALDALRVDLSAENRRLPILACHIKRQANPGAEILRIVGVSMAGLGALRAVPLPLAAGLR